MSRADDRFSLVGRVDSWIARTCRRRCVAQSVLFGVLMSLTLWGTAALGNAQADTLRGPHRVQAAELLRAGSPDGLGHRFVAVECSDAVETGVAQVKDGARTGYWAVPVGEKFLLVLSDEEPRGAVEGTVESVRPDLWKQFDYEESQLLLRFLLKEGDPRPWIWGFLALFAAGTGWLGFLCARSVGRALDPARHPGLARLAADGRFAAIAAQVEAEMGAPDAVPYRGWLFTRTYLIDRRLWRFDVRRWRDLVWAHKLTTQIRYYFVIPGGKSHQPVLCFADGRRIAPSANWTFGRSASESGVDEMLALVSERAPWAIVGFSDELDSKWRRSRASLCDLVSERRAQIESGGNADVGKGAPPGGVS